MGKKKLSIVVPVYFEEKGLDELYKRLHAVMVELSNEVDYEIIMVNDGSTDGSWDVIEKLSRLDKRVVGVNLSRNFGHQIAITAGMDLAQGDAVVVIDDDLQDPPEVILEMYKKWKEGYHVVYGLRRKRKKENFFKLFTAKLFYKLMNMLSDYDIPANVGDFRLIDRKVVEQLLKIREQNRYIRGLITWIGFKQCAVEYDRDPRYAGRSTYSFAKLVLFAFDGIISFSNKPLIISTYVGFIIILLSILYAVIILIDKLVNHNVLVTGWASMMLVLIFFSGVQLFSIGIIGHYISRIYGEVKNRPLYIIDQIINLRKKKI